MSLADDLLEQAEHLAQREPGKPKQASLRRALSTAYYSLFHLLSQEGAARIVTSTASMDLRPKVARAFHHRDIKAAAVAIAAVHDGKQAPHIEPHLRGEVADELANVCSIFVELQQLRHTADYNATATFQRTAVLGDIARAKAAHDDWGHVRSTHNGLVFLLAAARLLPSRP